MIKNSNFTDNNDYNTLYANLKQKSSKLNIESNKEIDNETEHKVISTVIVNEDDKEINLSEFTEKNSLLIDKFFLVLLNKSQIPSIVKILFYLLKTFSTK